MKLPKWAVLYVDKGKKRYTCDECPMFIEDTERCTIHGKEDVIKEHGTCGYWVEGPPVSSDKHEPMGSVTKEESGYEENEEGFSCKRCNYFAMGQKKCKPVEGTIKPNACCAAWKKSSKYGNYADGDFEGI